MPAGTLIQMGSQSTHLSGEACKGPALQKIIPVFEGAPSYTESQCFSFIHTETRGWLNSRCTHISQPGGF